VTYGDIAAPDTVDDVFFEYVMNQSFVLVVRKHAFVINDNAASLLTPVLQSIKPKISSNGNVSSFR
jgi:hypothetical protein